MRYYLRRNIQENLHTYGQPSRFLSPAMPEFDVVSVGEHVVEDDSVSNELATLWE